MRWIAVAVVGAGLAGCLLPAPAADAGAPLDSSSLDATALDHAPGEDVEGLADATSSGLSCTFNRDCPDHERCACDESVGCACELGPRGSGVNGVDTCQDGNDCQSSLCVEGQGSVYYCSGECVDAADCGPALPICADIAYLGRICVREP